MSSANFDKRLITIPFANGIIRAGSWRGSRRKREEAEEKVDEQETYFLESNRKII